MGKISQFFISYSIFREQQIDIDEAGRIVQQIDIDEAGRIVVPAVVVDDQPEAESVG